MSYWTIEDFRAYLMFYAANVDLKITDTEIDVIQEKSDCERVSVFGGSFPQTMIFKELKRLKIMSRKTSVRKENWPPSSMTR